MRVPPETRSATGDCGTPSRVTLTLPAGATWSEAAATTVMPWRNSAAENPVSASTAPAGISHASACSSAVPCAAFRASTAPEEKSTRPTVPVPPSVAPEATVSVWPSARRSSPSTRDTVPFGNVKSSVRAERFSKAPPPMSQPPASVISPPEPSANVPASTTTGPVKVFTAFRVNAPAPFLTTRPCSPAASGSTRAVPHVKPAVSTTRPFDVSAHASSARMNEASLFVASRVPPSNSTWSLP